MTVRSLLAVAAMATCSAGAAMAADLPMRSPPPAPFYPAPIFTWTGFYAGLNAGTSFDTSPGSVNGNGFTTGRGFFGAPASGSFGPFHSGGAGVGFVGGGQIGYNIQSGMFVYGIETDIDYFGGGNNSSRGYADSNVYNGGTLYLNRRGGDGYLGTVRGRLGLAAFDRTLLYVTGGLAYGDYGSSYRLGHFANAAMTQGIDFTGSPSDDTRVGYALGAGVEYAFTQHISAKLEYMYTDLGSRSYNLTNPGTGAVLTAKSDGSAQMARVGINYKF